MLLPSDPNVLTNEKFMISRVVFAVYHNDLLIASKKKANILNVKELMKAVFKIKHLDEVQMVLGKRVT